MGLEYQVMPSLRDVAHGGCFFVHLVIDQPQTGQVVWSVRAGGMDRPSRTKSHPASQAGRPVGPAL
jgi:hypothetical protein